MNLLDLIRDGAVLTAEVADGARMVLGPCAIIRSGRLIFFDLTSGRARSLKFDAYEWPHERGVWLIQAGDRVAYITRAEEHSPEAEAAWRRQWLDRPAEEKGRLLAGYQKEIEELGE